MVPSCMKLAKWCRTSNNHTDKTGSSIFESPTKVNHTCRGVDWSVLMKMTTCSGM